MHYPASPLQVDPLVTEPTVDFKREALKVMASITLFMFVYLLLMAVAVGLAVAAGYGGLALIVLRPSLITIMLGAGLAGLGIMVLFFLIKFLFAYSKVDRSHLVEVSRQQQPELFSFIEKLTREIGAPFPKKIYFSADVNASVFYDSGFWSMFLPIRKNLQIGLGLVNALTLSEFKAVLAHEFGHFSQRSMKLGSYVYNVNHVIFNLLYDNQGYGKILEGWGNISGYFAFFATITVRIVQGIQWVLQQMYGIINKTYMSLSRQMEFHADAVAASVSGSRSLASALLKLDLANFTQQKLYQTYNNWISDNIKAQNMFPHHREVMQHFAREFKLPMENGLPVVDEEAAKRLATSRVVVDDQWASHPSTEHRVAHLHRIGIEAEKAIEPAWVIFRDAEQVQHHMTEFVYRTVTLKDNPVLLDANAFRARYADENELYTFPDLYQGFYQNRAITEVDPNVPLVRDATHLSDILTPEVLQWPRRLEVLANDIRQIESITQKTSGVKTFEFDNRRYQQKQAADVLRLLREEQEQTAAALVYADTRIYALAFHAATRQGSAHRWTEKYAHWLNSEKRAAETLAFYADTMTAVQPIFQEQVSLSDTQLTCDQLRQREPTAKKWIHDLLQQSEKLPLNREELNVLQQYAAGSQSYFEAATGINTENVNLCLRAMGLLQFVSTQLAARSKKEYLEWQADMLR